jgi:aminopeptidase N
LLNAIEKATGRNMRAFFDQWVYGAGHPEFRIRQWWDERKKEAVVRVTQTHSTNGEVGLFSMNVEFLFLGRRGQKVEVARVDKKSQLFRFKLTEKPELVIFDPDHKILKRVDFPKNEDAWVLQLKKALNPLARIEAAQHLSRMGGKVAHQALRDALLKDNFWGVRAEVARAIGNLRTVEAGQLLLHGLDVIDHPKIRRAIYGSLESFGDASIAKDIEKRVRTEKSVVAESIALRAIGSLQHPRAGEILKEALKKDSWNDIVRIGALEGLTATRAEEWIPLLLTYTKPGHHQRLRMAAVRCLAQYGFGHDTIQKRLVDLLGDKFLLVQIAAMRGLYQMADERAVPEIKKIISLDVDGRLKRLAEETVDKITKGFEG